MARDRVVAYLEILLPCNVKHAPGLGQTFLLILLRPVARDRVVVSLELLLPCNVFVIVILIGSCY